MKIQLPKISLPSWLRKGNVALFCIALIFAVLAGVVTGAFTTDRLNIFVATAIGGLGSLFTVARLYDMAGVTMPVGVEPALLGTVVGIIGMLAAY